MRCLQASWSVVTIRPSRLTLRLLPRGNGGFRVIVCNCKWEAVGNEVRVANSCRAEQKNRYFLPSRLEGHHGELPGVRHDGFGGFSNTDAMASESATAVMSNAH